MCTNMGSGGFGKSGEQSKGRQMSIKRFLDNLKKNSGKGMLDTLQNASLDVKQANFTKNGNAVKSQEAVLENGEDRISVRFNNNWEPTQVVRPTKAIKQAIEIVTYKNGNATAIRTLAEKKSMSLKNAEKNYNEMLVQWKKLTKQRSIRF